MSKRRANGEGSIRKKPSGSWEGRYTMGIDPATGRAIQKSVSAKTQNECRDKLRRAIADNRGIPIDHNGDYTVSEWCRLWFETYSKPNLRPNTAKNYTAILEQHIIPAIGGVKLRQLTATHIQRMYNDIRDHGRVKRGEKMTDFTLPNSFVRRTHMVLHSCLQQAVKERILPFNPCDSCRIPKKDKTEMKIIPPDQVGAYLRAAEQYGVLPIFYLELSSGLRRGELVGLHWADLDVQNRIISVDKQITRIDGELTVTVPKTDNSIRKIVVPQQAVDMLVAEHEKHPDSPIMFPSPKTGTYWSPDALGRVHKKLLKMADIDAGVRFHDLRHTFATMAMQSGVDVKTLSSMLGHYSAGFTLDTYTHVTHQMQQSAADKVGGFMDEVTGTAPTPEPPDPEPSSAENGCKIIPFERVG